ncbi:MAG: hypothetical protein M3R29_03585 [Verrucomicrobiota bacterium]|nr:hypothetical protein [Verrucomicrobiota bacterium]
MKKLGLILLAACSLGFASAPLFAHDYESDDRSDYTLIRWGGLDSEINHLNRMMGHIRWELGRYRANWQIRREFERIRRDVNGVNWKFRQRAYDRRHLRREIERLHADLHRLEVQLQVRSRDYYRWR